VVSPLSFSPQRRDEDGEIDIARVGIGELPIWRRLSSGGSFS